MPIIYYKVVDEDCNTKGFLINTGFEETERMWGFMRIANIYAMQGAARPTNVSAKNKAERAVGKEDGFTLSTIAADFNLARRAVVEAPDIRTDKVNDILTRINAGEYGVSADDVANKILDQMA